MCYLAEAEWTLNVAIVNMRQEEWEYAQEMETGQLVVDKDRYLQFSSGPGPRVR